MASQERPKAPLSRAEIMDADYIPRDQAPRVPVSSPPKGSGGGISAVSVVMLCAVLMALAAVVSSGSFPYSNRETPSPAPAQTAEAYLSPAAPRAEEGLPAPKGEIPRLGIAVQDVTAVTAEYYNRLRADSMVPGVQIYALSADGTAALAGLRQGDIITALDDRQILSAEDLLSAESGCPAGGTVELTVYRDGQYGHLSALLGPDAGETADGD